MKKMFVLLLILALVMSFTACGVKEKVENKIGEAIGEKVVESLGDGNVDISGDKVTIKGEDGAEVTFGSTEWPKSDLVKIVPEFRDGKIVSVVDSETYSMIIIEEVDEKAFVSYYEDIKKNFTVDSYEMKTDAAISYGGGNGKGFSAQISYDNESKTFSIAVSKVENNN